MSNVRLSIVMATMATLSTVMLGLGQSNFVLALLTFLAAIFSVLLTDKLGWFQLNRVVANVAMLLAASFSLYGFLDSGSQQQLWAIANLLIYVQLVLLFQEKNRRVYGQLAMFSLLQVVVAALLNNGLEFGLLLGVYMVIALVGFVLFFVYREVGRVGMVMPRRSWFEVPRAAPQELADQVDGRPAILVAESGDGLNRSIVTWRIRSPMLAMISVTAVFTCVFFYTTPRTGGSNWERGIAGRNMVGFSPEVTFEEMGRLLQDDRRVMRVSFSNAKTGEQYIVIGEPYLRGSVLTNYVNGRWLQDVKSGRMPIPLQSPPDVRDLVKQDVLLEPTGSSRLFSMFPVYRLDQTAAELRIDPRTRHLYRSDVDKRDASCEYRYTVGTTAFNFGAQLPIIPHANRLQNAIDQWTMRAEKEGSLLNLYSREKFPRLIALANSIVEELAPEGDNYERARALEAHFMEPDRYSYTLDMGQINAGRDRNLDPVEDFVANHRMGHCEYFASALTLMLRSQGIPARMIVGFRPDERNYVGNYFVVRQRHAHAWVEAYLEPEEIPDDLIYSDERHAGGGWLRLDPVPPSEDDAEEADMLDRATNSFDYARWLWDDYVSRLTEERQRKAVLDPLSLESNISFAQLVNAQAWSKWVRGITGGDDKEAKGDFPWRGIVALLVLVAAIYAGYRLVRFAWPLLGQLKHQLLRPPRSRRQYPIVPFYQRLESALASIGLERTETQTQRQFAGLAQQHLRESANHASLAEIPHQIVDAFYRVRFGDATLTASQSAAIETQLQRLEEFLAN